MRALKNNTIFSLIRILCLAICGVLILHYCQPEPPTTSIRSHHPLLITSTALLKHVQQHSPSKSSFTSTNITQALAASHFILPTIGLFLFLILYFKVFSSSSSIDQAVYNQAPRFSRNHTKAGAPNTPKASGGGHSEHITSYNNKPQQPSTTDTDYSSTYSSDYQKDIQIGRPLLHLQAAEEPAPPPLNKQESKHKIAYKKKQKIKAFKKTLALFKRMLQGKKAKKQITEGDYNRLALLWNAISATSKGKSPQEVPSEVLKKWDDFRKKNDTLTIDMKHLYRYYQRFADLLLPSYKKSKYVGLFNKLITIFPNAESITCANIDCIGWNEETDLFNYSSDIVNDCFIKSLALKIEFDPRDTWEDLKRITITTAVHPINDNTDLEVITFAPFEWYIQKVNQHQLSLTKKSLYDSWHSIIRQGVIPKIKAIIGLKSSDNSNLTTAAVLTVFKKLSLGSSQVPFYAQPIWDNFSDTQSKITFNMQQLYGDYPLFMPILLSSKPQHKNILSLPTITDIFLNTKQITCESIDYVGKDATDYHPDENGFSASLVSSQFMLGIKDILDQLKKKRWHRIKKIILITSRNDISEECDLHVEEIGALGWQVKKTQQQIHLTKAKLKQYHKASRKQYSKPPYRDIWHSIMQQGVIPKIKAIIQGSSSDYSNLTSAAVMPIFTKLIGPNPGQRLPHAIAAWNRFTQKKNNLTIDIAHMYVTYPLWRLQFLEESPKHLLRFDKVLGIFPNVTQIHFKNIDCDKVDQGKKSYSPAIVDATFIKALVANLQQQAILEKVIFTMGSDETKSKFDAQDFEPAGWSIAKDQKKNQVTITKIE